MSAELPPALAAWVAQTGAGPDLLGAKLGIQIVEATAERVEATMPVEGNTQPSGVLSGGASLAFAETIASIGALLHAGPRRVAVGLEINATHHRPVRSGLVHGVATAIHSGKTMLTYEVVIRDERDRRVCTSRVTCAIHGVGD